MPHAQSSPEVGGRDTARSSPASSTGGTGRDTEDKPKFTPASTTALKAAKKEAVKLSPNLSSSDKDNKKKIPKAVAIAPEKGPDFTVGPQEDTSKDDVIDAQQQQIEQLSTALNDVIQNPTPDLSGIASAGSAPNPEMGGSQQRKSQLDLIESPEFDKFVREVSDEKTITDHIVDFFSPVKSVPTVNQQTGEFGVTTVVNPTKLNPTTRILDELFDMGLEFELGDFTSASDLAERRRDRDKTLPGERRDSDDRPMFGSDGSSERTSEKNTPPEEETDIFAQFFEDFFAGFGGFTGTPQGPQSKVPGTGQPVNPNFKLINNPEFIVKVTGNPSFSNSGG